MFKQIGKQPPLKLKSAYIYTLQQLLSSEWPVAIKSQLELGRAPELMDHGWFHRPGAASMAAPGE